MHHNSIEWVGSISATLSCPVSQGQICINEALKTGETILKHRDFSRWDLRLRLEETPHYDSTLLEANSLISLDNVLSTFHFSDGNRLVRRWLALQRPEHTLCVITSQWIWWTRQFVPDLQWNVSITYTIIIYSSSWSVYTQWYICSVLSFFRVRLPWIYIRNELRYISSPCMLEWVAVGFPP